MAKTPAKTAKRTTAAKASKKPAAPKKSPAKKTSTVTPPAAPHKHPSSLPIFFLTEMWERYGFYALQGTLAFFLTQQFGFSDAQADVTIGTFIALLYISPILGGILADRFLGFRHAIILGGILLFFGYALLTTTRDFTLVSLIFGCIGIGTGLLKANVSSLLGRSYGNNDPRRDSGFTIFYVGINTGALLAMGISGYIVEYLGWNWNFSLASMGMLLSLASFITGIKLYGLQGHQKAAFPLVKKAFAYVLILAFAGVSALLLTQESVAMWVFGFAVLLSFVAILLSSRGETSRQKRRLVVYCLLAFLSCLFFAIYNQTFIAFNLFISRAVSPTVFGFHLPPPVFMGFETVGVIIFGSAFSHLWIRLSKTRFHPSTPTKFAISFIFVSLALAVLLFAMKLTPANVLLAPFWILIFYFIVSFGELCISPIGLSMVTRVATPKLAGMMMGIWLFTIGIGGKIAGYIATFAAIPDSLLSLPAIKAIYASAFEKFLWLSIATFVIALLFIPLIRYILSGRFRGLSAARAIQKEC